MSSPLVSVVIPTYERPGLVVRALRSALEQDADLEAVVVVDGRDDETLRALEPFEGPRVRVVVPPERLGNAEARNEGVRQAAGEWIAFLDDDDEWLPGKLEAQLAAARDSELELPIVTCRFIARSEHAEFVWPARHPAPGERLDDYLFLRRSPFTGEGAVQTSTLLLPRSLAAEVPFRRDLPRHVDYDWLLRAAERPGAGLVFVADPAPLSVWNIEEGRKRITSGEVDWRVSLAWADSAGEPFGSRARMSFILSHVSATAARQHDWSGLPLLLAAAWRHHRPSPLHVGIHLANYLIPHRLQKALAARAGIGVRR